MKKKNIISLFSLLLLGILLLSSFYLQYVQKSSPEESVIVETIKEEGHYSSKEEVALYLDTFGHLPDNYITKKEARKLGWDAEKGNLWEVSDRMSIGGDVYKNYEKRVPNKKGRTWYECDIDYEGGHRNGKRIVFSSDGLIYYSDDHYQSFTLLYGDPDA